MQRTPCNNAFQEILKLKQQVAFFSTTAKTAEDKVLTYDDCDRGVCLAAWVEFGQPWKSKSRFWSKTLQH